MFNKIYFAINLLFKHLSYSYPLLIDVHYNSKRNRIFNHKLYSFKIFFNNLTKI